MSLQHLNALHVNAFQRARVSYKMADRGGGEVTLIEDCIEVAGSETQRRDCSFDGPNSDFNRCFSEDDDETGTSSDTDTDDSCNPNDTIDSLDSASTARARFQMSPDQSSSKSSRPQVCHLHLAFASAPALVPALDDCSQGDACAVA